MAMEQGAGHAESGGEANPEADPPPPAGAQATAASVTVMHWSAVDICARSWG
ncbi:uncharacterized protein LOC120456352 [Drosophila santomea]|uniref:uncharacterized protein LOC120456352 n=1 Tax=Drosophila santomea TaxID=129105 RepID=UPI001954BDCD|nr:uncharacterized protein LOC120456352 [Drosophila santomea]